MLFFFLETAHVDKLIEAGLIINDPPYHVLAYYPAFKEIILSNVYPLFDNDTMERILSRYGKQSIKQANVYDK